MPVQLPSGLASLLAKMAGAQAEGKGEGKGKADGKTKTSGLKKGAALGEDGLLLAGMGFNKADKGKGKKNASEQANIARFLQDPDSPRTKSPKEAKQAAEAKQAQQGKESKAPQDKPKATEQPEAKEVREAFQQELRREERGEDARLQGQEQGEQQEVHEQREARDAQQQQKQKQRNKDDDQPDGGHAWADGDAEGSEDDIDGNRSHHNFGEGTRCNGWLEDGSRCLRKPGTGSPFCAEHKVSLAMPIREI